MRVSTLDKQNTHRHVHVASAERFHCFSGIPGLHWRTRRHEGNCLYASVQKALNTGADPQRRPRHLPSFGQLSRLQLCEAPQGIHVTTGSLKLCLVGGGGCTTLSLKLGDQGSEALLQGSYGCCTVLELLDLCVFADDKTDVSDTSTSLYRYLSQL